MEFIQMFVIIDSVLWLPFPITILWHTGLSVDVSEMQLAAFVSVVLPFASLLTVLLGRVITGSNGLIQNQGYFILLLHSQSRPHFQSMNLICLSVH